MTNTNDSFVDEVVEEVRRDRLYGYLRRYGWIGILAVLGIVGGTAYTQWRAASFEAEAQAAGDAISAALAVPEAPARAEALAATEIAGPASAPKLMLEADAFAEAGETAMAADLLGRIAADPGHSRAWRDLAALKRILLLGAGLPPAERIAALAPLSEPGAPYRVLAREQEALARLEAGETDAALAILEALSQDQEATFDLRLRVAQLILTLDEGDAAPSGE